jgi:hypothetical protein
MMAPIHQTKTPWQSREAAREFWLYPVNCKLPSRPQVEVKTFCQFGLTMALTANDDQAHSGDQN